MPSDYVFARHPVTLGFEQRPLQMSQRIVAMDKAHAKLKAAYVKDQLSRTHSDGFLDRKKFGDANTRVPKHVRLDEDALRGLPGAKPTAVVHDYGQSDMQSCSRADDNRMNSSYVGSVHSAGYHA